MSTTIEQQLIETLVAHGMWPNEAALVMAEVKTQSAQGQRLWTEMRGRWEEPAGSYPEIVLKVCWLSLRKQAAEWLRVHKPKHFAIGLLDPPDVEGERKES